MAEQTQPSRAFCPIPFDGPTVRIASLLDTFRRYCTSNTPNRLCDDDIADDIRSVVSNAPAQVLASATLDGCIVLVSPTRRNRNLEPLFMCSQFLQPGTIERPAGSNSLRFLFSGTTSGVFSTDIGRECGARNRVCSSIGSDQPLGLGFALPTDAAGRESGETMLLHGCLQSGTTRRCSYLDLGVALGPSNRATLISTIPQFAWCGTIENPRPALAQALALLATAPPIAPNQPSPTPSPTPAPTSSATLTTSLGLSRSATASSQGASSTSAATPSPSDSVKEQSSRPGAQITAGIIGLIAILLGAALAAFALFLVRRRQNRLAKQEAAEVSASYGSLARRKSAAGSMHSFGGDAGGATLDRTGPRRTSLTPLASMHTVSTSDPTSPIKKSARYDPHGPLSPALPTVGLTRLPLAALISRPLDEILSGSDTGASSDSRPDLIDAFDSIFTDLESHIISQLVCSISPGAAPTPSPTSGGTSTLPRPLSAMSARTSNHQRAVRLAFATSALLSAVRGRPISPGLVPDHVIATFQALLQRMVRHDPGSALVMIAAGQSALRYTAVTRVYHAAEGAMVSVKQGGEDKELVRHTAVVEATCFPGWVGADGQVVVTARVSIS
ncbi:hypothetical protein BCR44DRAFT_49071 [Catenaria anguillulae PL171]|uniref:Uncharacterized protein n=1 Tax=Catenaria anguillulae PL171 TaxID=765915 RepID=A0A1Y2HSG5_9FUNG|nr:hypothetical protein BCR44DRAFT_49071 [Catenaria anguillulae PL171]